MTSEDRSPTPVAEAFRNFDDDAQLGQADEQQDSRPITPTGAADPFTGADPWEAYSGSGTMPQTQHQFAGAVTHPGPGTTNEGNSRNMMHDVPPEWDGNDPARNLEPYLKLLQGWLCTTATLPSQRGLIIMHYAKGDLRRLLDNLELDELTSKESGQKTFDYVKSEYSEYIISKKPLRIEEAFYDNERCRKKGEGMITYISRRKDRFNKLHKEGWTIPEDVKGYLLYRDAHLPDKSKELIELWTGGSYDWTVMQQNMKKLERPIPGVAYGDGTRTRLIGFQEDLPDHHGGGSIFHNSASNGADSAEGSIFMNNSYFLLPETFDDDETLFAAIDDMHDTDAIWLPEDFPEEGGIPEDIFITVLANYGQVRKFLHSKALGRGYRNPQPPGTKGKGYGKPGPKAITDKNRSSGPSPPAQRFKRPMNTGAPKRFSKRKLYSRTICARCGQDGHWARSCSNPPDEFAKRKMAGKPSPVGNISFCTGFMQKCNDELVRDSDATGQDSRVSPESGLVRQSFVLVTANATEEDSSTTSETAIATKNLNVSAFIGLSLNTNHGLVDLANILTMRPYTYIYIHIYIYEDDRYDKKRHVICKFHPPI